MSHTYAKESLVSELSNDKYTIVWGSICVTHMGQGESCDGAVY